MKQQRSELRNKLRERRRSLSAEQQQQAGLSLLEVILKASVLEDSHRVALYLASDGEIDPFLVVQWLWQQGKECYLPVLDSGQKNRLLFLAYRPDTQLVHNRFGIAEPVLNDEDTVAPESLDLVLMPLTGFDEQGQRLGMGGGFYDRTFSFKTPSRQKSSGNPAQKDNTPRLIGLAHECQKTSNTFALEWDIPMQGVVTDQHFYRCIPTNSDV